MAKKIPIISLNKQKDIGNSLETINNNFNLLQNTIDTQKDDQQEIQDFVDSVNQSISDIKYSYNFFKKNYNQYKETMEVLINDKEKYLKPIITLYPEKFRYDNTKVTSNYIQNVLHDWVTSEYQIYNNKLSQKPFYVEGQSIFVYFFRSSEQLEKSTITRTSDYMTCLTGKQTTRLKCTQYTVGTLCNCSCINCGGPLHQNQDHELKNCYYDDNGIVSNAVVRSITSNISYKYTNYIDNVIEYVKFVVEDCVWKVDNNPSSSISPYVNVYKETPLQFIGNTDHLISDNSLQEIYTFNE